MTIEVDSTAAEIIRRADALARSQGESLGAYLRHALPAEVVNGTAAHGTQDQAWNAFVSGMIAWSRDNLPKGFTADDSRDAMYNDDA